MKMDIILIVTICFCGAVLGSLKNPKLRLERVVKEYYDPNYVKNPTAVTSHSKRGDTYKTNITATKIHTWGNNITQSITLERATVLEQDSVAIKAATFTYRSNRSDSYKTNATLNLLRPLANNVTFTLYYKSSGNGLQHNLFTETLCNVFNHTWIMGIIKKYTDIPPTCPVAAKEYHFVNLELHQKNFPFSLPEGEHYIGTLLKKDHHTLLHTRGTIRVRNY